VAEASAPASSANLGPGFDILGLALEIRCRVEAVPADQWRVCHEGDEVLAVGEMDAVLHAARSAVGDDHPMELTVENAIPIARGAGSSAAAYAAGAAAAWRAMGDEPDPRRVFELVADWEGHPDNAAAAVYGGLVLCGPDRNAQRLPIHPGIHPVLAIPPKPLSTQLARRVIAATHDTTSVVRTLSRVAALVAGFLTADPLFFAAAAGDELHEQPRNDLRPEVSQLMQVARSAGALHTSWSGAGPSVLALVTSDAQERVVAALSQALPDGQVLTPSIAVTGLT
jgi:homoserine kinase